jgi:hypothetical protein
MAKPKTNQIELAEKLQQKILEDFADLLEKKQMTAADRATLCRLLSDNGWSLDPAAVDQTLADVLTKRVDPTAFDDDDLPRVN